MTKTTLRIVTVFSLVLLLQAGCAAVQSNRQVKTAHPDARVLVKTTQSWDGRLLPGYSQGQPEITILRITIPAGARLATHKHPVINAGVLLSGQLTVVTTDGKELHLAAGDPIVEVVDTLHYGFNPGDMPAEILVFYAGVVSAPITIVEQ